MAPLSFIQNPGLRVILSASIVLNLILGGVTLFTLKSLANAMATSQINIVEKIGSLDKHVGDIKNNVHDEMAKYTLLGDNRQKENNENFSKTTSSVGVLLAKVEALMKQADKTTVAANAATKASQAAHAKLNQKIITGPEADALKRAARKKTTVYKIFPWQ